MSEEISKASFQAADVFPAKLLHKRVLDLDGKIIPIHVQLSITNKCTLNCPFCSCSNRDKKLELSYEDIVEIMTKAKKVGCESVTITGGGEPTCHPRFNDIIRKIRQLGIKIGLVTNGTLIDTVPEETWSRITWCRISSGDHRVWDKDYEAKLDKATSNGPNVDWAFSHVITAAPNYELLKKLLTYAKKNLFTHVRLVGDILDTEHTPVMSILKEHLAEMNVDFNFIIYQGRKEPTCGTKDCLISLLKPVVGTNGMLYPCCGTQYAQELPSRDFGTPGKDIMCLGPAKDIDKIFAKQKNFDGSVCKKCYYSDYNKALKIIKSKLTHVEFV